MARLGSAAKGFRRERGDCGKAERLKAHPETARGFTPLERDHRALPSGDARGSARDGEMAARDTSVEGGSTAPAACPRLSLAIRHTALASLAVAGAHRASGPHDLPHVPRCALLARGRSQHRACWRWPAGACGTAPRTLVWMLAGAGLLEPAGYIQDTGLEACWSLLAGAWGVAPRTWVWMLAGACWLEPAG